MSPTADAFLRSWPSNLPLALSLVALAAVYVRGWTWLHRHSPQRWHAGQPALFLAGLVAIYLALASPIEAFAPLLLSVHMLQHMLLMMAAAPLVWLGAPFFPLLRGLPAPVRIYWAGPLVRSRGLRRLCQTLTHPAIALPLFIAATWIWHAPLAYEAALRSTSLHYIEHGCFLGTALLFWYPVVRPFPSRPRWSTWLLIPYLLLADVQNTVLSAVLTFADRPLYPRYAGPAALFGPAAVSDQAAAGVVMWIPGSIAYLVPLFVIGVRLLFPERQVAFVDESKSLARPRKLTPLTLSRPLNLLRLPFVGRFLRWQHARVALQIPLALAAVAIIVDGLRGPSVAAVNLAGVLPWIHWRGLTVLLLLVAGNFFCMACPFTLPRKLAGRWLRRGWPWPRALRTKWLAVALIALFFWAYETFSLWDSPWWTAWIAIAYFVSAFAADAFFRAGTFCKYLCPIGQFNYVQSLVSPLELKVLSPAICSTCTTKDCIRGRAQVPGCNARLFQPRKASNMDCTFCLDCVHACPHENVGLLAGLPGAELWRDRRRSGIGDFARRPDLAALIVVLAFGSLANAALMVGPVLAWEERLRLMLGNAAPWVCATVFWLLLFVAAPLAAVGTAAVICRHWGRLTAAPIEIATRFSFALVPLGFGMWLAHYGFHFFTSWQTAIAATQRAALACGMGFLGEPQYQCSCCRPAADWILPVEILFLDFGFLLSMYAGYRIAISQTGRHSRGLAAFAPWGVLIVLLFAVALWIIFQPMQMRGTITGAA